MCSAQAIREACGPAGSTVAVPLGCHVDDILPAQLVAVLAEALAPAILGPVRRSSLHVGVKFLTFAGHARIIDRSKAQRA